MAPDSAGKPYRDAFGFRQVIVVATPYSKVFGIDSSDGEILWSRMFGLGWAAETGGSILPVKLYVTQTVHDGDSPQVVIVAQRRAENVRLISFRLPMCDSPVSLQTLIDTVVYHIDASSGENVAPGVVDKDVLEGVDIISGPLVESFILPDHKVVVMLDEFLQVSPALLGADRFYLTRDRSTYTPIPRKPRRPSPNWHHPFISPSVSMLMVSDDSSASKSVSMRNSATASLLTLLGRYPFRLLKIFRHYCPPRTSPSHLSARS